MLIILEGPDGSGKSSLAEVLHKQSGRSTNIVNHGPYLGEPNIFHRYTRPLIDAYAEPDRLHIFDRCWTSEPIYGEVMRGGTDRIGNMYKMLDRAALGLDAVMILCLPPWKNVKQTFAQRALSEYPRREEQLERIWTLYRKPRTSLPLLTWDYTKDKIGELYKQLAVLAAKYRNAGPGVGLWRPGGTLMVGERQNDGPMSYPVPPSWVFIGDTGCSPWLADRLADIDVGENELYWVNALRPDGSMEDLMFIPRLRPARIIALGKTAHFALEAQGFEHIAIEHPQYQKRLHWNERWINLKTAFQLKGNYDLTIF